MDASGTSIQAAGLRGSRNRGWITGFQSSSETVPETSRRRPRSRPSAGRSWSSGNVRCLTSMQPPESSSRFSNQPVAVSSVRSGIKSSVEAARRSKERNRDFLRVSRCEMVYIGEDRCSERQCREWPCPPQTRSKCVDSRFHWSYLRMRN